MKKRVFWGIIALVIGFVIYQVYIFTLSENDNIKSIYLVPDDAVFIVDTERPIDTWDEISSSEIWTHLQTNQQINKLSEGLNSLDETFKAKKEIFDFIGERNLVISVHVFSPRKYGLLYVADLQKFSKLIFLKRAISNLAGEDYKVTKRVYKKHEIIELYNKKTRETLHLSFIKNQVIASYTHLLVEQSIDQYLNPVIGRDLNFLEIKKKTDTDGFFNVYLQHKYLKNYLNCFTSSSNLDFLNKEAFFYSGLDISIVEGVIVQATGYTNVDTNSQTYLKVLQKSGVGKRSVAKIAPKNTSLYLSFAFDDFKTFNSNLEKLQQENPTDFKMYSDQLSMIEDKLDINVSENIYSWIGSEIALIHFNTELSKNKKDIAAIIKADDIDDAKENLQLVLSKIKENTPLKYKQIDYRGYPINFFDLKGFFKMLAGNMFSKMEKPYFTIIDDYVVFSTSPNTIKEIINNHLIGYTLESSEKFDDFNYHFEKKSSVFAYVNTPNSYKDLLSLVDNKTRHKLQKNKPYITCFSQIGMQLIASDELFESNISLVFEDPKNIDINTKKDKELREKLLLELAPYKDSTNTRNSISFFKLSPIHPSDLSAKSYKEYYKNGQLKFEVDLEDGLKDGSYKSYYENGNVKVKGHYKKDKQSGTWKAYDEQKGDVIFKKHF
ncbi:DUF3352 domain-containing protein [Tenacibaculum sp. 1_MG-2023]|uniref:DUF3352 domain-containing protein n=1 Tax=Tenacibaculum sp. 1_MG-2023 TaxID=3062653 RepID=UPI0026E2B821|nr:DUF3352 domain-containing protein [Tenacibaculum sp. 1_MG-2023]MDO6676123.1 DUF3352 domain-containing protein [Tenacibaculum sp. 1_MG-2023]